MMRAVVYAEFGGPEVLSVGDVAEPHAGPGQIRVRVRAAGVNPVDWKVVAGSMAAPEGLDGPTVPGFDVAGTVDEVGDGVIGVTCGAAVFGQSVSGSAAEFAILEEWAEKPDSITWEVAGSLNVAGETAVRALDFLSLKRGEVIIVDGAAGGVGVIASQIALARGVTVLGTASEGNHDRLRAIGVRPLAYGEGFADRARRLAPGGIHAALDTVGKGSVRDLIGLTGDPSRVVTLVDRDAPALGVLRTAVPANRAASLRYVADLVAMEQVNVPITATYSLEGLSEAYRRSKAGHVYGKLVVIP